jgi:hypothetical protein
MDTMLLDIPSIADNPCPDQPTSTHWHFPFESMDATEATVFYYQLWEPMTSWHDFPTGSKSRMSITASLPTISFPN